MSIRELAKRWGRIGLGILYPPRCAYCGAEIGELPEDLHLCSSCLKDLSPRQATSCRRCGAAAPNDSCPPNECQLCRGADFAFDAVLPLGRYQGKLRDAVLRMKHEANEHLSIAMGAIYRKTRGSQFASLRPSSIVPIPMFWMRRLRRKTNSPDVLAAQLANFLGTPMLSKALRRSRNTLPQRSLLPRERFRNVRDAFRLTPGFDFADATVGLVDDVMTTGATCDAAARLLKQAGASKVIVAVLARAEGDP